MGAYPTFTGGGALFMGASPKFMGAVTLFTSAYPTLTGEPTTFMGAAALFIKTCSTYTVTHIVIIPITGNQPLMVQELVTITTEHSWPICYNYCVKRTGEV